MVLPVCPIPGVPVTVLEGRPSADSEAAAGLQRVQHPAGHADSAAPLGAGHDGVQPGGDGAAGSARAAGPAATALQWLHPVRHLVSDVSARQ